jgi:hypothetical protein
MDAYAHHLANIATAYQVTAQEDICNAQGLKLLARGSPLDESSLTKLAMLKLLKPLEDSVGIGDQLDGEQLLAAFSELAVDQADAGTLIQRLPLAELCSQVERHPLLCQRLTVMREVFPALFRRTLFGAVLVQSITKAGHLRGLSLSGLFIAALGRSLGLLHLPAELMQHEVQDCADKQRQFESYPVISREMIRRSIDPISAEAILDQHEHLDGSGFPRGWRTCAPRTEAQLLGIADFIAGLCLERVEGCGRLSHVMGPLRLLRPFWSAHLYDAANAMILELGKSCPPLVEDEARAAWLERLQAHQQEMAQQLRELQEQPLSVVDDGSANAQRQYIRLLDALGSLSASSGLLSPEYGRCISHVRESQMSSAYAEMDEVHLQLISLQPLLQRARLLHRELTGDGVTVAA